MTMKYQVVSCIITNTRIRLIQSHGNFSVHRFASISAFISSSSASTGLPERGASRCSKILKTSFDTDVPFIHLLHRLCTTFLKRYSYLFDDKICRKCFFLNLCHRTRKNTARNQTNFYKINQRNANSQNIKYQQRLRMKLADERSTSDTRVKKRNYFPTDAMIVRLYEE